MRSFAGTRYWLVGASEGLGRALAQRLSAAGAEVIVSARNEERLVELVEGLPGKASYQVMDVTDQASVDAAVAAVGPVDGMVYLAGVYWPMPVESWDGAQSVQMSEINYTGAVRAVTATLPEMMKRNAGHIVLTGSLAGFRGLPGAAAYGASKAAVMHLAESLYADLRRTGVDIQVVNPGFIKTRLTAKNDFAMPMILEVDDAADRMFAHMFTDRFKCNFPWAFGAMFRLCQFLPDWAYYGLMRGKAAPQDDHH